MQRRLTHIFRHPVKAIGLEALESVMLSAGACLPLDRVWAVATEAARLDGGWARCGNFIRGAKSPELMAVRVKSQGGTSFAFSHPRHESITLDLDVPADAARLVDWVKPLCNPNRAAPVQIYRVPEVALTDNPEPEISILNQSSRRALSEKAGLDLTMERFRGNLWLDGLGPWEELDLIGKRLSIGAVTVEVTAPIERCAAITANPESGRVDVNTLDVLEDGWGHRDFGVFARVIDGGQLQIGDAVS